MAALSRRRRTTTDIWPGFVDALATLLIMVIFVLMVFVLGQFFLGQALSGRDAALERLNSQVLELGDMLSLERQANAELQVNISQLSDQLSTANSQLDEMATLRLETRSLKGQLAELTAVADRRSERIAALEADLGAAVASAAETEAELSDAQRELALTQQSVLALEALKAQLEQDVEELGSQLAERDSEIAAERRLSVEAQAQAALMTQQLEGLQQELARLAEALDAADALTEEQRAQISDIGRRMNRALAGKVQELQRYRSEFFGRLRDILGTRPGIRVEGDRFVFQSEVLFASGSAELGPDGQRQLAQLARSILVISRDIPNEVDWILRVNGHTDDVPISTARFRSNWELSSGRAISVVQYLIDQGVAPERLAAAGFGEFQPIIEGTTAQARGRNRRIELQFDQR